MIIIKYGPKDPLLRISVCLSLLLLGAFSDKPAAISGLTGIDVSHFQQDIDWEKAKLDGVSFSYIKVSEGKTITDPKLSANWHGAAAEEILRGGYHVFTPGDDGKAQAKQFLKSLASVKADYNGALPPALDIESLPKESLLTARPEIRDWLSHVEAELGCKPIIYTSPATWDEEFPGEFTTYGLWLADYADTPQLPKGWEEWTFWQYTNTGRKRGIEGNVDLDRFNGGKIKLLLSTCIGW